MTQREWKSVIRLLDRPQLELHQHREKPVYSQEKALQSSLSSCVIKDFYNSRSLTVFGNKNCFQEELTDCHFGKNYFKTRGPRSLHFEGQKWRTGSLPMRGKLVGPALIRAETQHDALHPCPHNPSPAT